MIGYPITPYSLILMCKHLPEFKEYRHLHSYAEKYDIETKLKSEIHELHKNKMISNSNNIVSFIESFINDTIFHEFITKMCKAYCHNSHGYYESNRIIAKNIEYAKYMEHVNSMNAELFRDFLFWFADLYDDCEDSDNFKIDADILNNTLIHYKNIVQNNYSDTVSIFCDESSFDVLIYDKHENYEYVFNDTKTLLQYFDNNEQLQETICELVKINKSANGCIDDDQKPSSPDIITAHWLDHDFKYAECIVGGYYNFMTKFNNFIRNHDKNIMIDYVDDKGVTFLGSILCGSLDNDPGKKLVDVLTKLDLKPCNMYLYCSPEGTHLRAPTSLSKFPEPVLYNPCYGYTGEFYENRVKEILLEIISKTKNDF